MQQALCDSVRPSSSPRAYLTTCPARRPAFTRRTSLSVQSIFGGSGGSGGKTETQLKAAAVAEPVVAPPSVSGSSSSAGAGAVLAVHSPAQLSAMLAAHADQVLVLQCKSSKCRPCKAFAPKYAHIADVFQDCVFAEITGDESPENRALMKEWAIKSTPTFRLYRNGALVASASGAREPQLVCAIQAALLPGEAGAGYVVQPEALATHDN